jgi:succinoglycan biosynthesis protein ExoM
MTVPATASVHPVRVDIAICTFRRPQIEKTLRSLVDLRLPPATTVRIVVADNDFEPSARTLVYTLAASMPFDIRYIHCPASNISLARNACLDAASGDFLIFMDDDQEVVSGNWLAEILAAADSTGADVVLGPVLAVYGDDAPRWMREGDFHSTFPVWVKGEIRTGYSANTLLRLASPAVAGRRFSLALGRSGGEDTDYFTKLCRADGRIAYAPDAPAHEPVPAHRASFVWLAKRRFRSGQTHGRLVGEGLSRPAVARRFLLAAAKACYCFGAAILAAPLTQRRNRYALRGALHVGALAALLGVREIRQYGGEAPVEGGRHAA